jgi:diguanylate cyclase (GGDEF)-like protein/PAS domain S-box-containing protein
MSINVILAGIPAIATLISGSAAFFSWRRRNTPGARAFSLFTGCVAIWCFFSIFELINLADGVRLTLARFQYFGIAYFPVFWVIFTLQYTHQDARLSRSVIRALMVLPTINLILALTDHWHGLIWRHVTMASSPMAFSMVDSSMVDSSMIGSNIEHSNIIFKIEHGWWFNHILAPYQYLMFLAGIGILLHAFWVNSELYRRQILFLLAVALIPLSINVPYIVAGVSFYGIDMTPIGLAMSGIIVQLGLFRGRIFDLSPISYRTVFLNSSEAVILLDERLQIVDLNPSAYRETSYAASSLVGALFASAFPDYRALIAELPLRELTRICETNIHGSPQTKETKVLPLRSPGGLGVGWAIIIRDITLEYQQQSELKRIAYLDELTGVCNRRQLEMTAMNVLSPESPNYCPVALIYLDLNAFKPINDTYGHEAGDLVLRHVARCLQTSVRNGDLVVRLGGDEFVVMLFRANRAAADDTSDRIRCHLQKPIEFQGNLLQAEASIGIACFPQDGQTLHDLLRNADRDMYQHKQVSRVGTQRAEP